MFRDRAETLLFRGCLLTAVAALIGISQAGQASAAPVPDQEPQLTRPLFRWWWPNAMVKPEEIDRELGEVARAGFGGVEISSLPHQIHVDPVRFGWATPAWNAAVRHALETAKRLGLEVDITIGPAWPAVVPTITPDSPAAEKELVYGSAVVGGGAAFDAPVPVPPSPSHTSVKARELVAVIAYPCRGACQASNGRPVLEVKSAVDISGSVQGDRLLWKAPAGEWLVIAFWQRGTGQMDNMRGLEGPHAPNLTLPPAYAVDHFSTAGTDAVTSFWDERLLPGMLPLFQQVHGAIFEDSLELEGDPHWTPNLLAEFARRRGYRLEPFLPALFLNPPAAAGPSGAPPIAGGGPPAMLGPPAKIVPFEMDPAIRDRVRFDFQQTLSDLYIDYRVKRLKAWADQRGLRFRNQPYGPTVDSTAAAASTDVPEGESLGFDDRTDSFRMMAGGRDMAGLRLLSDECCADFDAGYAMTWAKMLRTMHDNYSGGVNRVVVHGLAYADDDVPFSWPGWAPMVPFGKLGAGFAEAWGTRIPTWQQLRPIADYVSRTQTVLSAGRPSVDVAIYRLNFTTSGGFLQDPALSDAGFNYDYVSPYLFSLPQAEVRGGKLAVSRAAYKALILNNAAQMPAFAAERILTYAKAGLPVVVVGQPPSDVPGLGAGSERVRSVGAELLRLNNVRQIAGAADLPAALASLGLRPDAQPANRWKVVPVHRVAGSVNYYWLYNPTEDAVEREVSFAGRGTPVIYDPWSGRSRPIGVFRSAEARATVRIKLAPLETKIVVLNSQETTPVHVDETTADDVVREQGRWYVRAANGGAFRVRLSNGRVLTVRAGAAPPPLDLTHRRWSLTVEDWQPGATRTAISKVRHTLSLDGLRPWSQIDGLKDVSGIGAYTTQVDIPAASVQSGGYYLDLGQVLDTAKLTVNGVDVALNQVTRTADLGRVLRPGPNVIEVQVATTLLNRMRVVRPDPFAKHPRQDYGLIGPVRLIPYAQAALPLSLRAHRASARRDHR